MENYLIFVFILLSVMIILLYFNKLYENFNPTNKTNLFYENLPNIFMSPTDSDNQILTDSDNLSSTDSDNLFLTDSNNQTPTPTQTPTQTASLSTITFDNYIYSDQVSKQIVCANLTSQADCWDNNNCQWINKIDTGSYCDLASKWLL